MADLVVSTAATGDPVGNSDCRLAARALNLKSPEALNVTNERAAAAHSRFPSDPLPSLSLPPANTSARDWLRWDFLRLTAYH